MKIYSGGRELNRIYVACENEKKAEYEIGKQMGLINSDGDLFGHVEFEEVKIDGFTIIAERVGAKHVDTPRDGGEEPEQEERSKPGNRTKRTSGTGKGSNK